ncbi:MAG: hypothetical protein Q8Q09_02975 [Deltaproteobacteria bacterium]|nr:hypothetical protein [Deltaproteobacteria bacterium]
MTDTAPVDAPESPESLDKDSEPHNTSEASQASSEPTREGSARPTVQRSPLRPAGDVQDTRREMALGLLAGSLTVYVGYRIVRFALLSFLSGGSSTLLALSVLTPISVPLLAGSIAAERGRKAFGYTMIAAVALAALVGSMYFWATYRHVPAALQPRSAVVAP